MLTTLVPYQLTVSRDASKSYMSTLVTYLADSSDTGGSFVLLEGNLKPGNEPTPHIHEREDELFYVLEGAFDVFVGDQVFELQTGGCAFLPRLQPHGFIIRSPTLRILALFQPGGIDGYFRSVSTAPPDDLGLPSEGSTYSTSDMKRIARAFADYGSGSSRPIRSPSRCRPMPRPCGRKPTARDGSTVEPRAA